MKRKFITYAFSFGGLESAATVDFWLTTGTKKLTLDLGMTCHVEHVDIGVFEGATQGAGGTPFAPTSLDRADPETADFSVNVGAAQSAAGTQILGITTSGNEANTQIVGSSITLLPSTTYRINLENFNAATAYPVASILITQDA